MGSAGGYMSTTEQRFAIWKNVPKSISTFHDEVLQTSFTAFKDDASSSRMLLLFKEHIDAIGNSNPSQLSGRLTIIDMADITLGSFIAVRYGDWLLNLPSSRTMIPLWYAYYKVNYERFLSYNYAIMPRLPK